MKGLQENFLQEMGDGDKEVPEAAWQSHRDPQGPRRVLTAKSRQPKTFKMCVDSAVSANDALSHYVNSASFGCWFNHVQSSACPWLVGINSSSLKLYKQDEPQNDIK